MSVRRTPPSTLRPPTFDDEHGTRRIIGQWRRLKRASGPRVDVQIEPFRRTTPRARPTRRRSGRTRRTNSRTSSHRPRLADASMLGRRAAPQRAQQRSGAAAAPLRTAPEAAPGAPLRGRLRRPSHTRRTSQPHAEPRTTPRRRGQRRSDVKVLIRPLLHDLHEPDHRVDGRATRRTGQPHVEPQTAPRRRGRRRSDETASQSARWRLGSAPGPLRTAPEAPEAPRGRLLALQGVV